MGITCGIDWAERHHDVALVDDTGRMVAKKRIDTAMPSIDMAGHRRICGGEHPIGCRRASMSRRSGTARGASSG
jgi:hypothetical protein